MLALDNIKKGEVIAFIPRKMCMTIREASEGLIWKQMKEEYLDYSPEVMLRNDYMMLMLYIMQERRNPFSPWYDWIATLDTNWDNQMIFYTREEFDWFEGSGVMDTVFTDIHKLQNDYQFLSRTFEGFEYNYQLIEFMEANILVNTKHVQKNDGIYYQLDLIPFVDQFHPTTDPTVSVEYEINNDGKTGYFIRAMQDIARGEKLYRPYAHEYSN